MVACLAGWQAGTRASCSAAARARMTHGGPQNRPHTFSGPGPAPPRRQRGATRGRPAPWGPALRPGPSILERGALCLRRSEGAGIWPRWGAVAQAFLPSVSWWGARTHAAPLCPDCNPIPGLRLAQKPTREQIAAPPPRSSAGPTRGAAPYSRNSWLRTTNCGGGSKAATTSSSKGRRWWLTTTLPRQRHSALDARHWLGALCSVARPRAAAPSAGRAACRARRPVRAGRPPPLASLSGRFLRPALNAPPALQRRGGSRRPSRPQPGRPQFGRPPGFSPRRAAPATRREHSTPSRPSIGAAAAPRRPDGGGLGLLACTSAPSQFPIRGRMH